MKSLLTFLFTASLLTAAPTLTLSPPSGVISGSPGQTVGWSFSLTNTTDYLLVNSVQFIPGSATGTFTDLLSPQGIVIGPSPEVTTLTQAWDGTLGLGSFAISPSAPLGNVLAQIIVIYDLFNENPFLAADPSAAQIGFSIQMAPQDVTIQITEPTETPEPATWVCFGAGLAIMAALRGNRTRLQVAAKSARTCRDKKQVPGTAPFASSGRLMKSTRSADSRKCEPRHP